MFFFCHFFCFCFFHSVAETIDFGLDQLDTKKKVRPTLGAEIALRLRFVPTAAQLDGSGATGTGTGYALVNSDGDAITDSSTGNLGASEGVELTATGASAATSAKESGSSKKAVPMKTATTTTAAAVSTSVKGKGKKTEAAFTSLVSGNKGDDSNITL